MSEVVTSDGLLRSKPPKPKLAIGRDRVMIAIVIIGTIVTFSIVLGSQARKPKIKEGSNKIGQPSYNITSLPESYSDLPPPKLQAVPTAINIEAKREPTEDLALKKMLEERRKRALQARSSSVTFQNLSLSSKPDSANGRHNEQGNSAAEQSATQTTQNQRDEANRQDDKKAFLEQSQREEISLNSRLISKQSPYQLMAGTIIPGLLLTGINSDLPGQILGQVSQNVYDTVAGRYLLLPQGTKVLGSYDSRIVFGQRRVLVAWTRMVFPNGKSISLERMPGVDISGYAGLTDQVNNHWGQLFTSVVISSLLSAGAQMSQGRGFNTIDPSYDELATQGIAKNINQVGQAVIRRGLNVQPTLEIRPGYRFNVFVHKDMTLEPYRE
jgi:type IV secretory pathway VirB10-like protein